MHCSYCFEKQYRQAKNPKIEYNLPAIFKRMEEYKNMPMTLHGGEPLLLPKKDVEKILRKMKELTGKSSMQTNGLLIDDDYIEIFKKYKTSLGISFDGPGELSKFRPGSARIEKTIEKLFENGISLSVLTVVSKANTATPRLFKKLKNYILKLYEMKIFGRLNPCCCAPEQELSGKKLKEVYLDLADFALHHNLRWSPFVEIIKALQGKYSICHFMGCDNFSTAAAVAITGDGTITNCMRTDANKKGILVRYPVQYQTRDQILSETPQEFGGCKNCKYWSACHGGCPSAAINNDWRNRTYLCSMWHVLFQFYEKALSYAGAPLCFWGTGGKPQRQKQISLKK